MDFSNTKRALASISSSLTELEKARVQYRSEIDQLSDQDYRRRYSEEAQVLENPQNLISHKDHVLSIGFSMDGFKRVR